MTDLIVIFALFLALYKYCYSSIWFVLKFIWVFITNIHHILPEAYIDIYAWFKGVNRFKHYGYYIYGGGFGAGKSLHMVKRARKLINYYKKWYKITIFSNMELRDLDYIEFRYYEQMEYEPAKNEVVFFLIDEAGSIFYSRNYGKTRLNENDLVLHLNQLRKDRKMFIMSSQRHKMVDAALRRVCTHWYELHRRWRFNFIEVYDGYEIEYETEYEPIARWVEYATQEDYRAYKTQEKIKPLDESRISVEELGSVNLQLTQYNGSKRKKKRYKV